MKKRIRYRRLGVGDIRPVGYEYLRRSATTGKWLSRWKKGFTTCVGLEIKSGAGK